MDPRADKRVEELFHEALDLETARRRAHLREACGGDPALLDEVLSLLDAYEKAGSLFDTPAPELVPGLVGEEEAARVGTAIGSFRIKRVVGSGGMGTVYEAEQERPHRTVALKTMRAGLSSRSAQRRFEIEAEILARLNHPSIAQVYEVGVHAEDGRSLPYFAMELVRDARTLLAHAEEERLGVRARLELFAQICDAVHHGHQKGVIHLDLKPSNVLVGGGGVPKVIDFGVARCSEHKNLTTFGTDMARLVGTLQYMSPEAFAGDPHDLDTRSDVYSLGVMLYELLTGRVPHEVGTRALAEAARVVQEEAPTRPSRIRHELRGDLETIILKALEKDRERRYASASALALDLRRYLRNEPIEARPPSTIYQLRKFVTRHRTASASFVLLFASLTGFGIAMAVLAKRARQEAQVAERVTHFLEELFSSANPANSLGEDVPVRVILERGRQRIDQELRDQPEVRARLLDTLAHAYGWLGRQDVEEALYREAIATLSESLGDDHPRLLSYRADLGTVLSERGDHEAAEAILRDVLGKLVASGGSTDELASRCRERLAHTLKHLGRVEEAERLFREAVALQRAGGPRDEAMLADALAGLAALLHETERDEEARGFFEESLALYSRARPAGHPKVAAIRSNYARCLAALGDRDAALEETRVALADTERILGRDNAVYGSMLTSHAHALSLQGHNAEAAEELRRALAIKERSLDADNPGIAFTCNDLGRELYVLGRYGEAETFLRRSLEMYRSKFQGDHPHLAIVLTNLAEALAAEGNLEEADRTAREGLAMLRRLDPGSARVGEALVVLSWILIQEERLDDAAQAANEAVEILKRWPNEGLAAGGAHGRLAFVSNQRGEAERAEDEARLALASIAESGSGDHLFLAYAHYQLGWARLQQGDRQGAEDSMRTSLEVFRRLFPDGHPDAAWVYNHLGEVIVADRPAEAVELFEHALEVWRNGTGGLHWRGIGLINLGAAQERLGRLEEAESSLLEAYDALVEHPEERAALLETTRRLARLYDRMDLPDEAAGFREQLARLGERP